MPKWALDVYDLTWRSAELKFSQLQLGRHLFAATLHRLLGIPPYIRVPLNTRGGTFLIRPFTSDLEVVASILEGSEYDIVKTYVKNPRAIVDLGANVGASIRLWSMWYPSATIIGVEPNGANHALANANLSNPLSAKILVHSAAINDKRGFLYIDRDAAPWSVQTSCEALGNAEKVQAITMVDLLDSLPDRRIDFLKCDIEGAEKGIFGSCGSWVHQVGWIMVETHSPYTLYALQQDLQAADSPRRLVYTLPIVGPHKVGLLAPASHWFENV